MAHDVVLKPRRTIGIMLRAAGSAIWTSHARDATADAEMTDQCQSRAVGACHSSFSFFSMAPITLE
jgi:hypothetical protein